MTPPVAPPTYARPTPAPPSSGPALPPAPGPAGATPGKPVPRVTESQSFYNAYAVAPPSSEKPAGGRCEVNFWNLSGQPLPLQVDRQTLLLAAGQKVRLDLGHQFVWQIAGRESQAETVPANESGVEIVLRR